MVITTKQFQLLTDIDLVWDYLVDIYDRENGSGMPAPFFEHAIRASWMDASYSHLDRLWFDGDKVVAFVYYEAPVTDIYFAVRKGYEHLADELIDYAVTTMPSFDGNQQFVLFNGQEFLKEAAVKRGYGMVFEYESRVFDFENELNYELPDGYHFVESSDIDVLKLSRLCWYGFDHGDRQVFTDWDKYDDSNDWTPAKSHKDCVSEFMAPSPHSTHEYDVVIAYENGEYVCFAGMWWIPQNKLAYMEPLCTSPEHRRRGLAAAALTEHYRRMKALGATHMSGGEDSFYEKIGYGKGYHFSYWKKGQ
jgi:GNAT superfamily N-acetyltransferase